VQEPVKPLAAQAGQVALNSNGKRPLPADHEPDSTSDTDDSGMIVFKWNCGQIRTKINQLLRSGEMKVTEFQRQLDVNPVSYGRYMKQVGPWAGRDNQTYSAATRFFLKREASGKKIQAKKPKKEDLAKFDVSDISLPGDTDDDVPVYDTCDDIRKKIQAHLRNNNVTQAAFMREVAKEYKTKARPIQSKQLKDFLEKKGATAGASSAVYYGSYVYFEKLRLKNGEKKSKKRVEVEENVPDGMSLEQRRGGYIVPVGTEIYEDEFGRVRCY
jgi:hypothetical protein